MATQDPADRTGRDADTELSHFTLDAHTSPASILSTKTNDETNQPVAHRWPARASLFPPSAPLVLGRLPMPPQQRVRSNQERPPPASREHAAECSKDRPVHGAIAQSFVQLTFENPDLVAEHHDLDVPIRLASPGRSDEAEDSTQTDVEE